MSSDWIYLSAQEPKHGQRIMIPSPDYPICGIYYKPCESKKGVFEHLYLGKGIRSPGYRMFFEMWKPAREVSGD